VTPTGPIAEWAMVDIATPVDSGLPGVAMAGFDQRAAALVDIAMVPHPAVTLFLDLTDGSGITYRLDRGQRLSGSVVAGLLPGDLRASGHAPGVCLQIRIDPPIARVLFPDSPGLTGLLEPLGSLLGRDAERLEERVRDAPMWNARFAIVTGFLRRRMTKPRLDPEVAYIWNRTRATAGRLPTTGMAAEVGWSRQRLWSRFRTQLGITPKQAAQLTRFDHAAHLLAAGQSPALTAATAGYTDQSHLHRATKSFTGKTPGEIARAPWLAIDDIAWPA
jgi:AraC-like DNA-binding protein